MPRRAAPGPRSIDWPQRGEIVDSRVRLRRLTWLFAAAVGIVFGRLVWLELDDGPQFRRLAARPIERRHTLQAMRGRILSKEGAVLAEDRPVYCVALDYRWIADPPDPVWLRRVARQRMSDAGLNSRQRRDPELLAAEIESILAQRDDLHQRLADLCGLDRTQWDQRASAVRRQVTQLSERVNDLQRERFAARRQADSERAGNQGAWSRAWNRVERVLFPVEVAAPPSRMAVAEEVAAHVLAEAVPVEVVAEIESRPELYPGARIVQKLQRTYPGGQRAAHLLGHVGPPDRAGRMGIERQYDALLQGRHGVELELADLSGKVIERSVEQPPLAGRDLMLTIDASLQAAAEELLDAALDRRRTATAGRDQGVELGGAIVALDVRSGAILAAASAPRFHPGLFESDSPSLIAACLHDPASPLVDRTIKMAIPPGSVFKVLTAIALLEQGAVAPRDVFNCQGFWRHPEHERCAHFIRHGAGHGPVTLDDALMKSCNVYFFHHAEAAGAAALLDWSTRLGLGRPTGVDLPDEAAGSLIAVATGEGEAAVKRKEAAALRAAVIGQGTVTATPLQLARMMAAVANGGKLVTPHVVSGWRFDATAAAAVEIDRDTANDARGAILPAAGAHAVAGLNSATLATIRRALERVVGDPEGTAHGSVYLDDLPVAGKTGTAESGGGRPDHAWFAGYAPADAPRVALVVALEHGGGGAEAAGPVARRLVQRLDQLGYLGRSRVVRTNYEAPPASTIR